MERSAVVQAVADAIQNFNTSHPASIDPAESTVLLGDGATLDSLGLVALLVEIEHLLTLRFDLPGALSDERALSQRRSPFRTVGTIIDHICSLGGQ